MTVSVSTSHLCSEPESFKEMTKAGEIKLNLASSAKAKIKEKIKELKLLNALHVPDLCTNLISVARKVDARNKVVFDKKSRCKVCLCLQKKKILLWHRRLRHLNGKIKQFFNWI